MRYLTLIAVAVLAMCTISPAYAEAPSAASLVPWQQVTIQASEEPKDEYACNCYLYARSKQPYLPLTKDLTPNASCTTGAVAILRYGDLMHYAVISGETVDTITLDESNFHSCEYSKRTISRVDPHIEGCWYPN